MKKTTDIETPQLPRVKGINPLIHIAGWAILICAPFFFTGR